MRLEVGIVTPFNIRDGAANPILRVLHIHIEGSLEPELMFEIAVRNGVKLPFKSIAEVRKAYQFTDLQSFLDIYYQGMQVLLEEQDFYDMTWAYLKKATVQSVRHTEIFFDPQAHTYPTGRAVGWGEE